MRDGKSWKVVATSPDCGNYLVREEKSWNVVASSPDCRNYVPSERGEELDGGGTPGFGCRNYLVRQEKSWTAVAHLALAVGTTW